MGDFLSEPPRTAPMAGGSPTGIELKMRRETTAGKAGPGPRVGAGRRTPSRRRPAGDNPYLAAAEAAAAHYERSRHLPPLIAMWPQELADDSRAGTMAIVERLEKALRMERRRRVQSHWCYDINRHAALVSALKAERQRLQELR